MKPARSAPTAFRFDPMVKAALNFIADRDGRSMANMMEWLIRKHCEKEGLSWPPEGMVLPVVEAPSKSKPKALAKSTRASAGKKQVTGTKK